MNASTFEELIRNVKTVRAQLFAISQDALILRKALKEPESAVGKYRAALDSVLGNVNMAIENGSATPDLLSWIKRRIEDVLLEAA